MIRRLRTLSLVLGTGFILFAASERLFWSFWRSGDDAGTMAGGWLIYSLFAYLTIGTGRLFRASGFSAFVMLGALFGWALEGVYAMTLYGDPSMPFPFTVAWTGLAWHATLSLGVGLVVLRRSLAAARFSPIFGLGLLIALFWGLWASGWNAETPPVKAEPLAFFWQAALLMAGVAAAEMAITIGDARHFEPSRLGLAAAGGVVTLFFAAVTMPAIPWSPLVLLPLLGLVFWALRRARGISGRPDAVADLAQPIRVRNLLGLLPVPPAATAVYAGLSAVDSPLPVHLIIAAVASLTGSAAFVVALFRLRVAPGGMIVPRSSPQHR